MKPWANTGIDLHLDRDPALGVRAGLERALRDSVRRGTLRPGERLPSSRMLAHDLGIARNTIAEVYAQLVAEGYLTSARGAGTRVADHPGTRTAQVPAGVEAESEHRTAARYDLRPGRPDLSLFPHAAWLAAMREVMNRGPGEALGYGDPRGPLRARRTLAGYLARVRGVDADPDRIVLCSGYRQAVALLAAVLRSRGTSRVAVESPGLPEVRTMVTRAGMTPVGLPVDGQGARVDLLGESAGPRAVGAVFLTPAHQFPLGVPLSPRRRSAALDWARRTGGIIVEDDYDGEFRYGRQPLGALQGLAPGHVVYAGSASKTLAPGLRLGWLVVPRGLLGAIVDEKRLADRHSCTLNQLALAELIDSGAYDRHIRRARLCYARRREDLTAALARRPDPVPLNGIAAGLHVVLPLPGGVDEPATVARLAAAGVAVNGMARYAEGLPTWVPGLVIGFATPPQHAWNAALATLSTALPGNRPLHS